MIRARFCARTKFDSMSVDSKYKMMWRSEWRPVVEMYDGNNIPTTLALRAVKAVLFVTPTYWVSTYVHPGEIVARFNRDPNAVDWEYID